MCYLNLLGPLKVRGNLLLQKASKFALSQNTLDTVADFQIGWKAIFMKQNADFQEGISQA